MLFALRIVQGRWIQLRPGHLGGCGACRQRIIVGPVGPDGMGAGNCVDAADVVGGHVLGGDWRCRHFWP